MSSPFRSPSYILSLLILCAACTPFTLRAHDLWLEPGAALVRSGDLVYVNVMLGNHGNKHRDFRLASKAGLAPLTLVAIAPDGSREDLKPTLVDRGLSEKEGFRSAPYTATAPGLHLLAATFDAVMTYAPLRAIHSAKTMLLAADSLDAPPVPQGFATPLGHPLELVPEADPVATLAPERPLTVRLLLHGKPLADTPVVFLPQGADLPADGTDPRFELKTDAEGRVTVVPPSAGRYLIAAHHVDEAAKGEGYDETKYVATLTLFVPTRPYAAAAKATEAACGCQLQE